FSKVPKEVDFFHSHGHYPCSGTYDEHTAPGSRRKGDEMPQLVIHWFGEHSQARGHQGHVVDHRRGNTQKNHHQVGYFGPGHFRAQERHALFQSFRKIEQYSQGFQSGNSQKYSQEKKDTGHFDPGEGGMNGPVM